MDAITLRGREDGMFHLTNFLTDCGLDTRKYRRQISDVLNEAKRVNGDKSVQTIHKATWVNLPAFFHIALHLMGVFGENDITVLQRLVISMKNVDNHNGQAFIDFADQVVNSHEQIKVMSEEIATLNEENIALRREKAELEERVSSLKHLEEQFDQKVREIRNEQASKITALETQSAQHKAHYDRLSRYEERSVEYKECYTTIFDYFARKPYEVFISESLFKRIQNLVKKDHRRRYQSETLYEKFELKSQQDRWYELTQKFPPLDRKNPFPPLDPPKKFNKTTPKDMLLVHKKDWDLIKNYEELVINDTGNNVAPKNFSYLDDATPVDAHVESGSGVNYRYY